MKYLQVTKAATILAALMLSGCATFKMTEPAPAQSQPVAVKFTDAELSGWSDLPVGAHRVPDSQVIVSGHQKGGASGMLFGLIGVAVQHAVNESIGDNATEGAREAMRITLTRRGQEIADELVATRYQARFAEADQPGAKLSVSSAVIVTFVGEEDVRPYVLLKASIGEGKQQVWSTRYIASTGKARPLTGEGGWTAESLLASVDGSLRKAIDVMLRDVSQPYPRDAAAMTTVEGWFPYVKQQLQVVGYTLGEDEDSIYFVPKLGDVVVFSGVNIMDKAVTSHRPAGKKDAFKVVADNRD
jgi:hypothetical protein